MAVVLAVGSSGSSLSKGDIQSAIEGCFTQIASDIHDKLTEKDTSSDDKKNADEQTRNNIKSSLTIPLTILRGGLAVLLTLQVVILVMERATLN
nr:hypothetical protein [Salmonella enterica]